MRSCTVCGLAITGKAVLSHSFAPPPGGRVSPSAFHPECHSRMVKSQARRARRPMLDLNGVPDAQLAGIFEGSAA